MYSVRGRTAATAANISDAVFGFWNPHTSQIVRLMALTVVAQTLIANVWLAGTFRRTTARGMPAATVTPDISNDGRRGANPVSGVLLDLAAFSVQPTLEADDWGPNISASQQANAPEGFFSTHRWQGSGLYIPPGTGIALIQTEAISSPAFEISLSWLED